MTFSEWVFIYSSEDFVRTYGCVLLASAFGAAPRFCDIVSAAASTQSRFDTMGLGFISHPYI
jgi:hypothetical protein